MSKIHPYCLTIAGFDPSGGAGVIADCKTFEQLNVHGLSVITCNTIQTEDQFFSYNWVDFEIISDQIIKLLERYPIRFIKIGLIKDSEILLALLQLIHLRVKSPVVIWDPIVCPTYDLKGNEEKKFENNFADILKMISVITPNLPEFKLLFGEINPENSDCTVYLKGGHSEDKGKDFLYHNQKIYPFNPKINTSLKKHGTGCIFSSALVAFLSREFSLNKSCYRAKQYVEKRILSNKTLLAYHK